eukprot:4378796-Amphidinium_carterae.1
MHREDEAARTKHSESDLKTTWAEDFPHRPAAPVRGSATHCSCPTDLGAKKSSSNINSPRSQVSRQRCLKAPLARRLRNS